MCKTKLKVLNVSLSRFRKLYRFLKRCKWFWVVSAKTWHKKPVQDTGRFPLLAHTTFMSTERSQVITWWWGCNWSWSWSYLHIVQEFFYINVNGLYVFHLLKTDIYIYCIFFCIYISNKFCLQFCILLLFTFMLLGSHVWMWYRSNRVLLIIAFRYFTFSFFHFIYFGWFIS